MNTYQTLRVATVQFQHKANDKTNNLAKIHQFIDKAATEKVNVLVFLKCVLRGIGMFLNYRSTQCMH